ncbi:HMG-box domain-containing protein [Kordiimonas aestuarii]|uniref:hypothetical protein n=1 Tax=Kordiimonas aestuarii TaxID=1005925 RepID=UPI0021CFE3C7|nr:hypothetical protein [Kordiimonas aestuarii]
MVSGKSNLEAVATEARRVLDGAAGLEGLSDFGSKALSAIAVGMSGQFSSSEIIAAKQERKSRVGASVQGAFQQSNMSGNPTDFSKRLITQYSSMSAEEREAAGLDQSYYDAIVKNYETSMRISQALSASTFTAGTASCSSNGSMSLLNFL